MEIAYGDEEILATSIQVVANPFFLLCAHTCTETKQTPESKPEFSACTSHERFPLWGPLTVEGSGQEIRAESQYYLF